MRLTITSMKHLCYSLSVDIQNCRNDLTSLCDARSYSRLTNLIHRLNRRLHDQISATKKEKFSRLATTQPARCTRNTQTMNTVLQDNSESTDRLVVGIPEDLPLDEDERSLLAKGINFIPTTPTTDEFTSKEDPEKFFRRLRPKAHFTHPELRPVVMPQVKPRMTIFHTAVMAFPLVLMVTPLTKLTNQADLMMIFSNP